WFSRSTSFLWSRRILYREKYRRIKRRTAVLLRRRPHVWRQVACIDRANEPINWLTGRKQGNHNPSTRPRRLGSSAHQSFRSEDLKSGKSRIIQHESRVCAP